LIWFAVSSTWLFKPTFGLFTHRLMAADLCQCCQKGAPILVGVRVVEMNQGRFLQREFRWQAMIEFMRLTKGLRTPRVDALGTIQ
jgi:hypothetical protein